MKVLKTEEHSSIAATLNNMAYIYSVLGENKKALEMNERAYSREG